MLFNIYVKLLGQVLRNVRAKFHLQLHLCLEKRDLALITHALITSRYYY